MCVCPFPCKIQFRNGDVKTSMETAKAVIEIKPDGHALVLAGILAYKNEVRLMLWLFAFE